MGGVLIIASVLLTSLLINDLANKLILLVLVSMLMFAAIGFIDDYRKFTVSKKGLAGKKKLLFQGTIGLMVWAYLYYIGFTGRPYDRFFSNKSYKCSSILYWSNRNVCFNSTYTYGNIKCS